VGNRQQGARKYARRSTSTQKSVARCPSRGRDAAFARQKKSPLVRRLSRGSAASRDRLRRLVSGVISLVQLHSAGGVLVALFDAIPGACSHGFDPGLLPLRRDGFRGSRSSPRLAHWLEQGTNCPPAEAMRGVYARGRWGRI